jgi:hypothetical protein
MKRIARIVVAVVVAGFAVPALACDLHKATTTQVPTPAPAVAEARAEKVQKVKARKVEKAKASPGQKVATTY